MLIDSPVGEKMSWTEDRVELLKKLWTEGLSASQIAGRLGCGVTRNAVIGKVHRLNLSGRAPQPRTAVARPRKIREPSHPGAQHGHPVHAEFRQQRAQGLARPEPIARQLTIPEPKPLRLVDLPKDGRVTILHLSDKTCKWPIGDPGTEEFCFCGHGPRDGSPYCEYHARIAYQPLQDRRHRKFASGR